MVHRTAIANAKLFFDVYLSQHADLTVVEIGSQNVNGSIKSQFSGVKYVGLDFAPGQDVDIILEDPYYFPLEDNHADVVVTSSCFEHSEFFWLTFMEGVRILKPGGLFYLNAPSNGLIHRYPVDCWRFYPDSGRALANWAQRQGQDVIELESYTSDQNSGYWNDYVAVFLKDSSHLDRHQSRIIDKLTGYANGRRHGDDVVHNPQQLPEDQRSMRAVQNFVGQRLRPI